MVYICKVMTEIVCPSCSATIQLSKIELEQDDHICNCGYLVFLDETQITTLRIVASNDLKKCS